MIRDPIVGVRPCCGSSTVRVSGIRPCPNSVQAVLIKWIRYLQVPQRRSEADSGGKWRVLCGVVSRLLGGRASPVCVSKQIPDRLTYSFNKT